MIQEGDPNNDLLYRFKMQSCDETLSTIHSTMKEPAIVLNILQKIDTIFCQFVTKVDRLIERNEIVWQTMLCYVYRSFFVNLSQKW
jgi:hypothetical protein